VFQEKDIPIQVAVGNYDLGICGRDWIDELLAKYPASGLVKVRNLGYGRGSLSLVCSPLSGIDSLDGLRMNGMPLRLVSEYPNLAEAFALKLRMRRFQVLPLWGAAEVYPPESADLALISTSAEGAVPGLVPLASLLPTSAFLIANRSSWERRDIAELIVCLMEAEPPAEVAAEAGPMMEGVEAPRPPSQDESDPVRLALPDGHQQPPTADFLKGAGLNLQGYSSSGGSRRPTIDLEGVNVKVIRPQDMPLQVANGNFDLAITGRDWLLDHLYRFPSSPARALLDLGFGRVRIVAVISQELPVESARQLVGLWNEGRIPGLRVASEYVNIADKYARDNHLGPYRVIPTWGASEAFLPEDADLLIENTETGQTLSQHNLKIIDTLFESTACVIGHKDGPMSPARAEKVASILQTLRKAGARDAGSII
jgi:ATP phosphoribosyltransferase